MNGPTQTVLRVGDIMREIPIRNVNVIKADDDIISPAECYEIVRGSGVKAERGGGRPNILSAGITPDMREDDEEGYRFVLKKKLITVSSRLEY